MKSLFNLTIMAIFFFLAATTNPSQEEYISWISNKLVKQLDQKEPLTTIGMEILGKPILRSSTSTKNFILFSIYYTSLPDGEGGKVLGIFNTFIPLTKNN